MALSDIVKNMNDGIVTLIDGTGTPLELVIPFDNGDFSATGIKKKLNETAAYESRGKIKSLRHTTRRYVSWSFTGMFTEFTNVALGVVSDWVLAQNGFSARISTADIPGDVDQMHVKFTYDGLNLGEAADQEFTLRGCEVDTFDFSEGDPDTFSMSGTAYLDVTDDLVAAEIT